MNIYLEKTRKDSNQTPKESNSYLNERIGFWACVISVNSDRNSVDVMSDTGYKLIDIPVMSKEWICNDEQKTYISASRNLPPVNSRVFVLMPSGTVSGSFVLCSGFAAGEKTTHELFAKNSTDVEKLNNIEEKITCGGWTIKEYYSDGNKVYLSLDGKIKLEVCLAENNSESLVKGIKLSAFNNVVQIDENGINLTDCNNTNIKSTKDGIDIKDAKSNTIKANGTSLILNGNLEVSQ